MYTMKQKQFSPDLAPLTAITPLTPSFPTLENADPPTTLFGVRASDIERYARVAFPVFFFTFHLMYWTILISMSGHSVQDLIPLQTG